MGVIFQAVLERILKLAVMSNIYVFLFILSGAVYFLLKKIIKIQILLNIISLIIIMLLLVAFTYQDMLFAGLLKDPVDENLFISQGGFFRVSYALTFVFAIVCYNLYSYLVDNLSKKSFILSISMLAIIFIVSIFAFDQTLEFNRLHYTSNKISSTLKIIHITDIHCTVYDDYIVDTIKGENPDLIVLTGDIVDDWRDFAAVMEFLDKIKDVCPLYYSSGNHELWSRYPEEVFTQIEGMGITFLRSDLEITNINGDDILIAGLKDVSERKYDPRNYIPVYDMLTKLEEENRNFDGLRLLLSHRPEYFKMYSDFSYDFVFSGHAHGGQVHIPYILNGLYAPNQGFFPKYAGGVYKLSQGGMHIVSRGAGVASIPRIFNKPEIIILEIEAE